MLAKIAEILGILLQKILPALFDELKKPGEAIVVGDEETIKAVHDDIANTLSKDK